MNHLLAPATSMGAVSLKVANLDVMTNYYRDGIKLDVLSTTPTTATLGRRGTPIVILEHAPHLKHATPGAAGLFHTAVLFDTKADLAASLYGVATNYPNTYTGSADHLVSLAFYTTDPEGNGVELYWDRPRDQWQWNNDRVSMATLPLDPNEFLQTHLTTSTTLDPLTQPGVVGHVHLSVGDVATAKDFYVNKLGFATTAELSGSALFVSAGGYHHHMAMNIWNSRGASVRAPALGLALVRITLPTNDDLGALNDRMLFHGTTTQFDGQTLSFDDPWANRIHVTIA